MSIVYGTNTEYLGKYSELVGDSTFIARTRKTLNGEKLLVDVSELYPNMPVRADIPVDIARDAARHYGARTVDYSRLHTWFTTRKVSDISGIMHNITIAHTTFVFFAVK